MSIPAFTAKGLAATTIGVTLTSGWGVARSSRILLDPIKMLKLKRQIRDVRGWKEIRVIALF